MVNFLKTYWWVLLIIAGIVVGIILYFKKQNQDIAFDFNVDGDINSVLSNLSARYASAPNAKGIGLYVDVPFTTIISNKSALATTLSNIIGSITYNGDSILQTNANSPALANVAVNAKSSTPVTDTVQVLINPSSIKFFTQLVQGNKPTVKYNFGATVAGTPYHFSNTTTINKTS